MMNLCMPILYYQKEFTGWNDKLVSWEQDTCYIAINGGNTCNAGVTIGKFIYKNKKTLPFVYFFTGEHGQVGLPNQCDNSDDGTDVSNFKIYEFLNKNKKVVYDSNKSDEIKIFKDTLGWNLKTTRRVFLKLKTAEILAQTYFDPEVVYKALEYDKTLSISYPNYYGDFSGIAMCGYGGRGGLEEYFKKLGYPPDIYSYKNYAYVIGIMHIDSHGFNWSGDRGFKCSYSG